MDDFVQIISTAGVAGVLGVCLWVLAKWYIRALKEKDVKVKEFTDFLKGLLDDKS